MIYIKHLPYALLTPVLLFGAGKSSFAQNYPTDTTYVNGKTIITKVPVMPGDTRFVRVTGKEPVFVMGLDSYFRQSKILYPGAGNKSNIHGTISILCTIQKDGAVANARVITRLNPTLDKEALNMVEKMPAWIPAEMGDHKTDYLQEIDIHL